MEADLPTTAIAMSLALAIAIGAGAMGARPPDPKGGVRLIPWRFIMLIAGTIALMLGAHLLTLTGLKHDTPIRY